MGNTESIELADITYALSHMSKANICEIENVLIGQDKTGVSDIMLRKNLTFKLFDENVKLKKIAGQINIVIHALGILLSLNKVLDEDELISYLSLGAGNTGKRFDLETNKRVAEYKFIDWAEKSNTVRQNNVFKDFYELAVCETKKDKYLYCYNLKIVEKFFMSKRSLNSVLSKGSLKNNFFKKFGDQYTTVNEFYNDFSREVILVDLITVLS